MSKDKANIPQGSTPYECSRYMFSVSLLEFTKEDLPDERIIVCARGGLEDNASERKPSIPIFESRRE